MTDALEEAYLEALAAHDRWALSLHGKSITAWASAGESTGTRALTVALDNAGRPLAARLGLAPHQLHHQLTAHRRAGLTPRQALTTIFSLEPPT